MGVAALAAAVSPWVWPWTAARVYGVPDSTQFVGSERTSQIVSGLGSGYLTNALAGSGVPGLVLVLAASLLLVGVPALLALRILWPLEMIAWGASYMAMVIIVTPPSPSILRYLVLASGFPSARIEYRSPVAPSDRLQAVAAPAGAAIAEVVETFNANVEKLNARMFSFLDYAIVGSR